MFHRHSFLIISSLFLLSFFYYGTGNKIVDINEEQLKFFLQKKQVEKVILVRNKGYVEVTINEKGLKKRHHQKLLDQNRGKNKYYIMKIPSINVFEKHYQAILRSLPPAKQINYIAEDRTNLFDFLGGWNGLFLLILILFFLLQFFLSRFFSSEGGGLFNIGKSKATLWGKERQVKVKLSDVAGMKEEKVEIEEIIKYLKNPKQAESLGGKIPKGILLEGAPGTGKTLLARAIAGEAGVPFLSVSGSDFVELFVGVGPLRVANLFKEARKNAPCIIFIDEIDAIGGARSNHGINSNEERENTLNKLLAEMDGFDSKNSEDIVIVIAATNRANILDAALLRPGRFDRKINIGLPSKEDREKIFSYHIKNKGLKIANNIKFSTLALEVAPGVSGADIANICNEAALLAARKNKKAITINDFEEAIARVSIGLEKKSRVISPKEKKIVAWHEAGHAVAAWFLEHAAPLVKVSIIPRGPSALGYAQYLPKEQSIYQLPHLLDRICVMLAARVAEEMTFGMISTGASDDLKRSTRLVYDMITKYGMSKDIGHFSFDEQNHYSPTASRSDATNEKIDQEARLIINKQYKRAMNLLKAHKEELKKVAETLLEKEVLSRKDLEKLIGKRPFEIDQNEEIKPSTPLIAPAKKRKQKKLRTNPIK